MNRWMKPLAISVVVHGTLLGSGAFFLASRSETPETSSVFPVSLVFDPSIPGPSGSPAPSGPVALPAASPAPGPVEKTKSDPAPVLPVETSPAAAPTMGASESTGGSGNGNGFGTGGEGSGNGGGKGGGGMPSNYEPPRLLAGALPLDPDKGVALTVPPEIPVRLRVGADGRVKEIVPEIEHLAPAVLDALHRSADAMRFAPARRGGEPVEGWFAITFVYRH